MADVKTMIDHAGAVGPTIPVAMKTDTASVPGDYHDYKGLASKVEANSYDGRMPKLVDALGNKDSIKG